MKESQNYDKKKKKDYDIKYQNYDMPNLTC